MRFITLVKFKKKDFVAENLKMIEEESKKGINYLSINWTLGRYDAVAMFEAPYEKEAMRMAIRRADFLDMEPWLPSRRKKRENSLRYQILIHFSE